MKSKIHDILVKYKDGGHDALMETDRFVDEIIKVKDQRLAEAEKVIDMVQNHPYLQSSSDSFLR